MVSTMTTNKPFLPTNTNPWDVQKVLHLYRRAGFGASIATINTALQRTPTEIVNQLVDEAINKKPTAAPEWANWTDEEFDNSDQQPFAYRRDWKKQFVKDLTTNNLRDRLTLFWMNHFVTEDESYNAPTYMYDYYRTLQTYAIGNFKEFTRAIGTTSAMLIYLNGFKNRKKSPNENYARELYELFTWGLIMDILKKI